MGYIHLCKPDGSKSCAACCGLYNYVNSSRESLRKRLRYRSGLFREVREGNITLKQYRQGLRHREDSRRIYETIYSCEFVGFLDTAEQRVGCMLHPMQNNGDDWRETSFYGRDLCEGHFCPSYSKLGSNEARIVIDVIDDWYLYGIIITDIDFVKTFFKIVQDRLGEPLRPEILKESPVLRDILLRYFKLKESWPFRDSTRPRFGKYYFIGEDYDIDRIDYANIGADPSPYDVIFLSLSCLFKAKRDLDEATIIIDGIIDEFYSEYRRSCYTDY